MVILDVNKALSAYDSVTRYDLFRFTTCLQGLLNREKPQLFLLWEEHDRFWLDYMTGQGKFLEHEPLMTAETVEDVLRIFTDFIRDGGLIFWDEDVPSTLNAATTACAVLGYLPRYHPLNTRKTHVRYSF